MLCRDCETPITASAVPGLPLCEQCVAGIVEDDTAPLYDAIADVLTEEELWTPMNTN